MMESLLVTMLSSLYRPVLVSQGLSSNLTVGCVTTSSLSLQQAATKPQTKPFNAIPGPKPLPLIGNMFDMIKTRGSGQGLSVFCDQMLQRYGGDGITKLKFPGVGNMVVVADPYSLEEVLRAEGKYPVRDTRFGLRLKWFHMKAGFPIPFVVDDGEAWRQGRMATNNQIHPTNMNSYIDGLNPIYWRFSEYLKENRNGANLIEDVTPLTNALVMEATAKFVFGADLDILFNPREEDIEFLNLVDRFFNGLGEMVNGLPVYKVIRNKFYYFFLGTIQEILARGDKYARRILEKEEKGESSEVQGMLEQWLREKRISTIEALALSVGMLTAGIHTTATRSTFLLFEMAKNPEAQEKLYQEIQTVLGDRAPTAQDLEDMKYMRGCIMESFRVRSVTARLMRILYEDAVLNGYNVPAGTTLLYSTVAAGKNERLFEDTTQFKPERWIKKDGPQQHPFALLPFGFGPRNCYGKRFAEMEMRLLLIEIARNFKLETEMEDMKTTEALLTTPDEKVALRFIDRH